MKAKPFLVFALALILAFPVSVASACPGWIWDGSSTVYSPLDDLGRPGPACAMLSLDALPFAPRSSIGRSRPPGYQSLQFDGISSGGWLYNRTHLIGSLFGGAETAENMVTGTMHLNQVLMYPLEKDLYQFLQLNPDALVVLRVVPLYFGAELIPRGLFFFSFSISGPGYFVFRFLPNSQPGFRIDYYTGDASPIQEA